MDCNSRNCLVAAFKRILQRKLSFREGFEVQVALCYGKRPDAEVRPRAIGMSTTENTEAQRSSTRDNHGPVVKGPGFLAVLRPSEDVGRKRLRDCEIAETPIRPTCRLETNLKKVIRCLRKPPSSARGKTRARASPRARKPENSSARRFVTSAKASMVLVPRSRPLPSACQKHGVPV